MTGKTVWLDVLTPKQALLMHYLALRIRRKGYETFITCRKYDYTESLLKSYGENYISVGEHGGGTLIGKLLASADRTLKLAKIISEIRPSALISYPSPSGCRAAFGLKIPIVLLTDTPHAIAVNKLTLPLAKYVVFSKCISRKMFKPYITPGTKIVQYNGVEELEWTINYRSPKKFRERTLAIVNVEEPFIIFRPEETEAAYYKYKPIFHKVLEYLKSKFEGKIVFLPRYVHQKEYVLKHFRENVIIPKDPLDLRVLYPKASMVITGGATIAREAALTGVPSISYFPVKTPINECVSSWGFPLYNVHKWEALKEKIDKILHGKIPKLSKNVLRKMYSQLERPSAIVMKILEEIDTL